MRAGISLLSGAIGLSAALLFLISAPRAHAEIIEIHFTGLDLEFDGTDIFDAGGAAGYRDTGDTNDADLLSSVSFFEDGALEGTDVQDAYADVLIKTVSAIPATGGAASSSGNSDDLGMDIFDPVSDWKIQLNIEDFGVGYVVHPMFGPLAIVTSGAVSSIEGQNLPHGLTIGTPVTIVTSSTNFSVETAGGEVTKFVSSGTGSIAGVPEPSTLVGLFMGALGLAGYAWRRRKR